MIFTYFKMSLVKSINNLYKSSLHQKDYYNYYNCLDTKYYLTSECEDLKDFIKKEKNRKDYCRKINKQFIPNRFMDFHEYIKERNKLYEIKANILSKKNRKKRFLKIWLEQGLIFKDVNSFYEKFNITNSCERCRCDFLRNNKKVIGNKDRNFIVCKKCLDSFGRE